MIRTQCETNEFAGLAVVGGSNARAVHPGDELRAVKTVLVEKLVSLLIQLNRWRARAIMGAYARHWRGGADWGVV